MKRRDFLKLIGLAPIAPSVLAAKERPIKGLGVDWSEIGNNNTWISYSITIGQDKTDFYCYKNGYKERSLIMQWNRDLNRDEVAKLFIDPYCAFTILC